MASKYVYGEIECPICGKRFHNQKMIPNRSKTGFRGAGIPPMKVCSSECNFERAKRTWKGGRRNAGGGK